MRNPDTWKPSKYRLVKNSLRASTNSQEVGAGSRLLVEVIAKFYDRAIPNYVSGRLIDLGCGKAPLFLKYRSFVSSVTCVDWGNTSHKNENLDVECDLSKRLPFDEASFDAVILSDVLEHLPNPDFLWCEMARILAPGGRLLMNVPYFYPLHEIPFDFYRYSRFALERFARESGFEIIELQPLGGSPEVFTDILAKHIQFIPIVGRLMARSIQALTLAFVRTTMGGRLSMRSAEYYPFGYAMVASRRADGCTPNSEDTVT